MLDHGLSWRFVANSLAQRFRCIAVDLRGHGHSDWVGVGGDYAPAHFAVDIASVLHALDLRNVPLVAHSIGGFASLLLALTDADLFSKMLLLESLPPAHMEGGGFAWLQQNLAHLHSPVISDSPESRRAARKTSPNLEAVAERFSTVDAQLPLTRARALSETATEAVDGGYALRSDPLLRVTWPANLERERILRALPNVADKVLYLQGKDSAFYDTGLASELPFPVEDINGSGHNLHHDVPEVVAARAREWCT